MEDGDDGGGRTEVFALGPYDKCLKTGSGTLTLSYSTHTTTLRCTIGAGLHILLQLFLHGTRTALDLVPIHQTSVAAS